VTVRTAARPALRRAVGESGADVVGIDPEHVADVLEGEHPIGVAGRDPGFGLFELLTVARVARERVALIALDRVLKDGQHQPAFAVYESRELRTREHLVGQHHFWIKKAVGFAIRHRRRLLGFLPRFVTPETARLGLLFRPERGFVAPRTWRWRPF